MFTQKSPTPNHIIQSKSLVLPADCNNVRQLNGIVKDINTTVTNISSGTVNALRKTAGPGHVANYDPRSDLLKAIRDGNILTTIFSTENFDLIYLLRRRVEKS